MAQSVPLSIKYVHAENFSVNEGLSQGLVNGITQDHFGFLWFATLDGLNRYDGYHVTVFRHDPDDSSSISENFVTCVFEDSKNRLWVGTNTAGLDYFDFETESFVHFSHLANVKNSISDDRIISIDEDNVGNLWVATKKGLNKISLQENRSVFPLPKNKTKNPLSKFEKIIFQQVPVLASGKEAFISHEATSQVESFFPSFFIDSRGIVFIRTENNYFYLQPSIGLKDSPIEIPHLTADPKDEKKIADICLKVNGLVDRKRFLFI